MILSLCVLSVLCVREDLKRRQRVHDTHIRSFVSKKCVTKSYIFFLIIIVISLIITLHVQTTNFVFFTFVQFCTTYVVRIYIHIYGVITSRLKIKICFTLYFFYFFLHTSFFVRTSCIFQHPVSLSYF